MKRILEICVDSLASAKAAIRGGADRLELCSALTVGGLTPYTELLRQIRQESAIPIRCLIRPRAGDFCYTADQIDLMATQMEQLSAAGADGFVIGILTPEGDLDEKALCPLINAARGKALTLHRCIDVSRNLEHTYRQAAALGFDTVLTSGGAANCRAGKEAIASLLTLRQQISGPEILVGAGVNAALIAAFLREMPQISAFHMSGKQAIESSMVFRREGVPMGIPGLDEWHIQQTDEEAVRQAGLALKQI